MSSELHEIFRRDLDRIPLRPEAEWTPRPLERATRLGQRVSGLRMAARAFLIALLVITSTGAGVLLAELRRSATDVASPSTDRPSFIPGRDLVHLADGEEGSRGLVMVEMPEGRVTARLGGEAYVGSRYVGSPILTGRDLAFLPIIRRPDRGQVPGVSLRGVDLRTGVPTTLIDAGSMPFVAGERQQQVITGPNHLDLALSADGSSVFLVRDTGTDGLVTVLERYDSRSGARLATQEWTTSGREVLVWARLVPLDGGRMAVVRHLMAGNSYMQQEWHFVDADLKEISSLTIDVASQFGACALDVLPVVATREWLIVCSDPGGFVATQLLFLDERFRETARVELSRELGFAAAAVVMGDGSIAVLTQRPLVARVDPRAHAVIDKRPVVAERTSLLDLLSSPVAAAKEFGGRSIVFSPDGNFAYLARSSAGWIDDLALIDLRQATVVAQSAHAGPILLSPDGGRLYVLSGADPAPRLILLDPGTLREVAKSEPLSSGPFSLIAVAPR